MIVELKGYDLHLGVLVLKGVDTGDAGPFLERLSRSLGGLNLQFQALNLSRVAGLRHVLVSTLTAIEALRHGLNVARSLPMEIVVRASGQHQIGEALRLLGIGGGRQDVLVAIVGKGPDVVGEGLERLRRLYPDSVAPHLLEEDRSNGVMGAYGISEDELMAEQGLAVSRWEAVKNLVTERVALTLAT